MGRGVRQRAAPAKPAAAAAAAPLTVRRRDRRFAAGDRVAVELTKNSYRFGTVQAEVLLAGRRRPRYRVVLDHGLAVGAIIVDPERMVEAAAFTRASSPAVA